jgi:hypothetical protein
MGARRGATDEAGRIVQGGHPCGERIWLCRLPRRDATKMGLEAMDRAKGYIGKPTPAK